MNLIDRQIASRTCNEKLRLRSKNEAKAAARRATKQHGKRFYFYECPWPPCRGWHLTTMRPEEFRARSKR